MKRLFVSLSIVLGLAGMAAVFQPVSDANAINVFRGCQGNGSAEVCRAQNRDGVNSIVQTVIDLLFWVIAIIAVIMIIIGGIKYVTSNGDSSQITSAKNTVLYSIIGLAVALLAYAIVRFVIARFG